MYARSIQAACADRTAARDETATAGAQMDAIFEAVFDASPSGLAIVVPAGERRHLIVSGNAAMATLFGSSREELHGCVLEHLLTDTEVTLTAGAGWREYLCRMADGNEQWTRWHVGELPVHDGHLLVQIDVIHDRVLARLRAKRQARLLDLIPEPVIIRSPDGAIQYWNRGAADIYGYSAEQAVGLRTHDLLQTRFHGVTLAELETQLADEGSWRGQLEHRRADGRTLRMASKHVRDTNVDGETVILEVNVDITDQHAAELALAASEIKFRSLFASSQIGQMVRRMDGTIEEVNDAFAAMIGATPDELVDTTPDRLLGESLSSIREKVLEALHNGSTDLIKAEGHLVQVDGSLLDVEVNASLVRDREGTVERVVSFWQDITQRKAAEQALSFRASHDTLTGLANRALLLERVGSALHEDTPESSIGLIYLDLDGFKTVNDTLGHQVGDHLLSEVANRLMQCVRETDTVARLGGDEFVLLCPELEAPERLRDIAERALRRVSAPYALDGRLIDSVSASIGLSYPQPGVDPEQALAEADRAMYAVKRAGKNNISTTG